MSRHELRCGALASLLTLGSHAAEPPTNVEDEPPLAVRSNAIVTEVAESSDEIATTAEPDSSVVLLAPQRFELRRRREATVNTHFGPVIVETLALLVAMRVSEAYLWPEPFSFRQVEHWPARYRAAFTQPPVFDSSKGFMQWDGDRWGINVIGHGLFGSELYLRSRRCGFGWIGAFGSAVASSTLWEYGFEANGVRPSGVDLWYTPLSGLLFGEARFQIWRLTGTVRDDTWRTILGALVDPVGEFASGVVGGPC